MIDLFTFRLILSFFIGAIWIIFLTILSEKYGTKIGGAIAGIPATMVVALFFIGFTQSPEIASQSTTLVPITVGVNALFVVFYVVLSKYNFFLAFISSIIMWFIFSLIILLSGLNNFYYSLIGYLIFLMFTYFILEKRLRIVSEESKEIKYSASQIIFRGIIGGFFIALAVFLAKTGGPFLGGVFASFPALTIALILIMQLSHGKSFSNALLKNFIISGTINVIIFTIFIRYTYLYAGLVLGTLISFTISLLSSYLTYKLINKNLI